MTDPDRDLEQSWRTKAKSKAALRAAVREALVLHKQAGNAVAVWRDGKVEWMGVEQLEDSEDWTA